MQYKHQPLRLVARGITGTLGAGSMLVIGLGLAQAATGAETNPEMTFFEYLAEMVETEDGWVDPLEMEEGMTDLGLVKLNEPDHTEVEASDPGASKEVSDE